MIADGSELKTIPPASGLHNYGARIPVEAGDFIGIRATTGECALSTLTAADTYDYKSGTATAVGALGNLPLQSYGYWILDISATLEPDADNDGYGDESQDQCLGQTGEQRMPGPASGRSLKPAGHQQEVQEAQAPLRSRCEEALQEEEVRNY